MYHRFAKPVISRIKVLHARSRRFRFGHPDADPIVLENSSRSSLRQPHVRQQYPQTKCVTTALERGHVFSVGSARSERGLPPTAVINTGACQKRAVPCRRSPIVEACAVVGQKIAVETYSSRAAPVCVCTQCVDGIAKLLSKSTRPVEDNRPRVACWSSKPDRPQERAETV